jgi:hypothetical protein
MVQPISTHQGIQQALRPSRVLPAILAGGSGFGALLLLGALSLWFHNGTAVFFGTIVSGLTARF